MIYKGKKRKLIMEGGSEYVGFGFGEDTGNRVCELVFNTSPVVIRRSCPTPHIPTSSLPWLILL